jgi:hypothetical protein
MGIAVEMRLEDDTILADFGEGVEAEDLESARVGEDRAGPGHELVESTKGADGLVAGPEEEVVGIREDDPGVELGFDVAREDSFECGLGADGHEYGGFDDAVSGVDESGTRTGGGAGGLEFEVHWKFLV